MPVRQRSEVQEMLRWNVTGRVDQAVNVWRGQIDHRVKDLTNPVKHAGKALTTLDRKRYAERPLERLAFHRHRKSVAKRRCGRGWRRRAPKRSGGTAGRESDPDKDRPVRKTLCATPPRASPACRNGSPARVARRARPPRGCASWIKTRRRLRVRSARRSGALRGHRSDAQDGGDEDGRPSQAPTAGGARDLTPWRASRAALHADLGPPVTARRIHRGVRRMIAAAVLGRNRPVDA